MTRLILSGWLIYNVAQRRTWALVVLLVLMTLAHEASALCWRRLVKGLERIEAFVDKALKDLR